MVRIIYIEHEKKWQDILRFSLPDYSIIASYSGKTGLNMVRRRSPDVVLLNHNLPDMGGLEVLKEINSLTMPPPVIILGTCEDPSDVITAIHYGAVDFLSKPYIIKDLKQSITKNLPLKHESTAADEESSIILKTLIGESSGMRRIKHAIISYALSEAAILITGETGTGKDIIAHLIHRLSGRKNGPYQVMPAGAMPFPLLESQLYGTEKGAFTDAISAAGYFERAHRGTLFIDEIGEMSPYAQVKLLRILEENEITRIGGTAKIPIDVRIVSATNIDLYKALKSKHFRNDLFYRINALSIAVPPLRERVEDIPLLISHFLSLENFGSSISNNAVAKMMEYSWPGNIRELRNVIHRAMVLSGSHRIETSSIITEKGYYGP